MFSLPENEMTKDSIALLLVGHLPAAAGARTDVREPSTPQQTAVHLTGAAKPLPPPVTPYGAGDIALPDRGQGQVFIQYLDRRVSWSTNFVQKKVNRVFKKAKTDVSLPFGG